MGRAGKQKRLAGFPCPPCWHAERHGGQTRPLNNSLVGAYKATFFTVFWFSTNRTAVYWPLGIETINGQAKVAESLGFEVVV